MGNILQDMMGLLSRKKVVKEAEPTDFILLGRTPNPEDSMFVTPKMNNQLITVKDLRREIGEGEISGGGTVNTIAMFTPDGSTIGDSIVTQDSIIPQLTVNGELRVSTNAYVVSNLIVDGNTTLNGDLQIGNQATDVLTVNSETEFNSNVVFDTPGYVKFIGAVADNTSSLGTAGQILSSTSTGVEWIDAASGTGTVESITALSPLTGGTITETGSIGINQASTSADGYLSSTDWNTFNSKQSTSEKGQADGYAPLDSNNKVPTVHLPDSLVGAVVYQGTWDASADSPTLPTPDLSNKGHYYIVSVPGTYLGITYAIGDWAISNGSAWQKVDNTQDVNSVFGRQGNVVANKSDYATFYADIDDAYSDAKVDLNLNVASAASTQVLSWSGTDYVWVDQQSGNPGTVTTVSASTAGDALDVLVANQSSTPDISLTWAGDGTQYIDGEGNLQTFPTIPTGAVTSVGQTHAGNAFSVTGSPITTSGVLGITLNGDATQYIDGAGDLQTFPSIPTLPANIVNTVTGGTNITTTNDTITGDVIVNAPDAIVNTEDTFGGPKVTNIVSLTSAEYPPAGGADPNTLYIIL